MFGTSGIRGRVGEDVTSDLALDVGRALAAETSHVVVGRDARESGEFLADALVAGLRECGTDVTRLGPAATPTIARSVGWLSADAGVAVTASHNPPEDNGFKLWQPSGQAFDEPRQERITQRIRRSRFSRQPWDRIGSEREWVDARERHAMAIAEAVGIADLTVAVDLGNGVGGVTVDALREMGCSIETLNAEPDGSFPGRPSEPTAETCESLRRFVEGSEADLGIAHDGDADRMQAVTEEGEWIPGDALLAMFADEVAEEGDRVAVPVDTSLSVSNAVEAIGASVVHTKVGDVFVAERASEPGVVFGGEPSGAWIWPEETLCPDAPLAAAKLVDLVAERGPLSELVRGFDGCAIERTSVEVEDKIAVMERIEEAVRETYEEVTTLDGVRVDFGDAWFLLRASGTESIIRVSAEATDPERADDLFEEARGIVEDAR